MLSFASISLPTERLILRQFQTEDADALYLLNSDPEVLKYTAWKPFADTAEAKAWIESAQNDQYRKYGYGRLAVILRETGELIGWSGIKFAENFNTNTIGYRFLKKYWGKGFATEAAKASVLHGIHTIGLDEISGFVFEGNKNSESVLRKTGFVPAEIKAEHSPATHRFVLRRETDRSFGKQAIFESERIAFYETTRGDADVMYALNCDREVVQYTGDDPFESPEAANAFMLMIAKRNAAHGYGRWKIISKQNGECLGWCGLKLHEDTGNTDVGYRLFRRHWGKGFASEAAQATIEFGFQQLGLKKIVASARKENAASLRVLEKCGMKITGEGNDCGGDIFEWEIFRP